MNKLLLMMVSFLGTISVLFAQGPVGHWRLGGNGPTPPLDAVNTTNNMLGTINNIPIRFITNNTERMRLTTTGFLGINTTTPLSMLHINGNFGQLNSTGEVFRTNTRSTLSTYWRMFRGTEKGSIYNLVGEEHFRLQAMQDQSAMVFHLSFFDPSFGGALIQAPNLTEVMRLSKIVRATGSGAPGSNFSTRNITRATISALSTTPIITPRSLLHIGFNLGSNGGWRNWMDIGLFANAESDNLYVGMKDETPNAGWSDSQSAVITWSDNQLNSSGDANRLRFIFTSLGGSPLKSAHYEGLEVARMVSNGYNGRLGVGDFFNASTDPQNTVEIRSNIDPLAGDTRSGLRLTNLTALLPVDATANSSGTVLSVDDDGDVILVEGGGGIQGCNNLLNGNAAIQLNSNNFYFEGQQIGSDRVGIGLTCNDPLESKFQVLHDINNPQSLSPPQYAGHFHITGIGTTPPRLQTIAVYGLSDATSSVCIGGDFLGQATSAPYAYGVRSAGTGASQTYGGHFYAFGATTRNIGIYSTVGNASGVGPNDVAGLFNGNVHAVGNVTWTSDKNLKQNITPLVDALGMLSNVKPSKFDFIPTPYMALPSGLQYGVIAQDLATVFPNLVNDVTIPEVLDDQGNIIHPAQTYKSVNYTGLIPIAIQGIKELDLKISKATLSDAQLKQNVQPLQNSLSLISQLEGVSFDWNQLVDTTLELPSGTEIGLIAQAVEAVIPEVIYTDSKGYKHVEYQKIVPVLIEANKELQDSLANLKNQLATLSQQVAAIQDCMDNLPIGAGCNGTSARTANPTNNNTPSIKESQKISLETTDMAILYQNEPNPFNNITTIRYYLPNDVNEAVMVFHDEFGREIGRNILTSKGYSQIEIDSEKLAAGIYTYSLIIDGKVLETKKMVKIRN